MRKNREVKSNMTSYYHRNWKLKGQRPQGQNENDDILSQTSQDICKKWKATGLKMSRSNK